MIERQPLWNNRKHEHGPFDIIGDVHGCFDELCELLRKLGYEARRSRTALSGHSAAGAKGGVRRRPGGSRAEDSARCCGW